ncbi:peptidoglycan-binding domain-containing protein [Streptomyces sp. RFCAC02]|uniref:peptidoglycan-binding domain-containing protein n=1 Tax=Streptomyces sp. RFCAC02 TaxID=2499143 RepID=UPI00102230B9|nr:peptidoglycan-binding domain-containing protein [Streptomyces sp. RFCAC02]
MTDADLEAQCLLRHRGFNTGTVDGIFGSNSQAAARLFQATVNKLCGRQVLETDGIVGPRTWPYLRRVTIC